MEKQIEGGQWVTLRYRLFDAQGEPVEEGERTLRYLHGGYGMVFPAIERGLEGRAIGENAEFWLEPEDHFGDYDAELLKVVPVEALPEGIEVGMALEAPPGVEAELDVTPGDDPLVWTITDIADGMAVLDGNHPLAGITLRFEIEVVEIEPATEDEIETEREAAAQAAGRLH